MMLEYKGASLEIPGPQQQGEDIVKQHASPF